MYHVGGARDEEAIPRGGRGGAYDHHDEVGHAEESVPLADRCREKLLARTRSIKVLDYALQTEDGAANCERFVEMLGLKTFFSAFMGKVCHNTLLAR